MTGKEVLAQIRESRTPDQQFIKWWRKEEDWLDFDVIDTFAANVSESEEIDGFELVGYDEMWQYLEKVAPGRVARTQKGGQSLVSWRRKSGEERECPYTPQSLVDIFDAETEGNYVD
ncbi:MAG TPA: hypothetical protein VIU40_02690 [Geobacteraceae bacterium]